MTWTKLSPHTGTVYHGCLHAPAVKVVAPMDLPIAVGFGEARITKDGAVVFDEADDADDFHYLQEFEDMARTDPDHDWRCILDAPLRSVRYQRHGENEWALIYSGPGVA